MTTGIENALTELAVARNALISTRNAERTRLQDRDVFNPATRPDEYAAQQKLIERLDDMVALLTVMRGELLTSSSPVSK